MEDRLRSMLSDGHQGTLSTIKRDGRPQLSNVLYAYIDGVVHISTTSRTAKIANLRRDPRVSLLVAPQFWSYATVEGNAELTPVTKAPTDATADELVDVYRHISGEHPDWDEFRQAMVDEGRLVIRIPVDRVYGHV
jgi:PPOX class probable F420-dependent enzyme